MRHLKILLVGFFIFLPYSVFAMPKPEKCPSLSSLQALGFYHEQKVPFTQNEWMVSNISKYDTNESWGFVMMNIPAQGHDEALQKGNDALKNLTGNPSPELNDSAWVCEYTNNMGYDTFAMSSALVKRQRV